jgi:hypothetical protein
MLTLIDELSIAECYVCPIEYYDVSGLNDCEIPLIDAFLEQYRDCCFEWSEEPSFTRDSITGMMATCLDVKVYKNEN